MPKKAAMEAWKKKRRIEYLEKRKYRYYIFCEGEQTEPLYFEGFKHLIECCGINAKRNNRNQSNLDLSYYDLTTSNCKYIIMLYREKR